MMSEVNRPRIGFTCFLPYYFKSCIYLPTRLIFTPNLEAGSYLIGRSKKSRAPPGAMLSRSFRGSGLACHMTLANSPVSLSNSKTWFTRLESFTSVVASSINERLATNRCRSVASVVPRNLLRMTGLPTHLINPAVSPCARFRSARQRLFLRVGYRFGREWQEHLSHHA